MAEENLHMDDAFEQMANDFKVNYDSSFWNDALTKLNDASLDEAFRAAAQSVVVGPVLPETGNVDDVFMDAAFSSAATEQAVNYNPDFYKQFQESEASLQMDEAFQTAAAATVVDYLPNYWNDADAALTAEGLHYEYNSAYWAEAKKLLDKSDRAAFFTRWTSIAGLLLLISFSTQFIGLTTTENGAAKNLASDQLNNKNSSSELLSDNDLIEDIIINNNTDYSNELTNDAADLSVQIDVEDITVNLEVNQSLNTTNPQANLTTEIKDRTFENLASTNIKSPLFSQDENLLSIYYNTSASNSSELATTIDSEESRLDISALNRAIIGNVANDLSALPNLEINKGQDRPKGMHSFSVLANAGVGNRWGDEILSPSLRTTLGVGYNYAPTGLLRNFDVASNIQLNHVRQNNLGVEKRSNVYEYNGDVSKYWYKLQLKDIIYANTNFTIGYRLGARHKINVGFGVDYLLAVGSNMSFKDKDFKSITTVNDNWGVKDGINLLDVKVGLGYEYLLNNKFSLTLNANYGLLDRTDDDFLNQVRVDKEMNIMVGFKYTLFRKI